jgi:hypothetical protein
MVGQIILLYNWRIMKITSFIFSLVLMSTHVYAEKHCKNERNRTYAEQLARLDPRVKAKLIDLDFFEGGSFVAGYEYEVEPAYTQGLYSRKDSWLIKTEVIPQSDLDITDGVSLNLQAGLKNQNVATFKRFFSDPCSAMKATPYSPRRMPLTAKVALSDKFEVGDYFIFRGSVGFVAGAELMSMISSSFWGLGVSGNFLTEGFYQLHVVRLDSKKVRLKVLARRGRDTEASVGLGFENDFDIFKIGFLDNRLEKIVNTKPIKVKGNLKDNKVFMVDYVLDLTDESVVEAYEKILDKIKNFKNIKMTAFRSDAALDRNLILDLTPLEDLYASDFRTNKVGRITRNLKTTSNQKVRSLGLHLGNSLLGIKFEKETSTAYMDIYREDDTFDKYLLKSWERFSERRVGLSWTKTMTENNLRALFLSNQQHEAVMPVSIVKDLKKRMNRFDYADYTSMMLMLKKALPVEIYNEIPWRNWNQDPKQKFTNYGLRFEMLMSPSSIMNAPMLSSSEIINLFNKYQKDKGLLPTHYFTEQLGEDGMTPETQYNQELAKLADILERTLNRATNLHTRLSYVNDLHKNQLFTESGIGFLMSLKKDEIKDLYHIDLNISSNEANVEYNTGFNEYSRLYKKVLSIKAALDDDALDLLREAESLSTAKDPGLAQTAGE